MKKQDSKDQYHHYKLRLRNLSENSLNLDVIRNSLNNIKGVRNIQFSDGTILFSHYISPDQIYQHLGYQKDQVRIKSLLD